jgi:hypothetical protein
MGSITTSLEAFCLRARRRTTGRTEKIGRAGVGVSIVTARNSIEAAAGFRAT